MTRRRSSSFGQARRPSGRYIGDTTTTTTTPGDEDYMASGSYSPTVTVTGTGSASATTGVLSYMRVGNAGGPAAGDTVVIFGSITLTGMATADVVGITLPFPAFGQSHGGPATVTGADITAISRRGGTNDAALDITVTGGDTSGSCTFSLTYNTQS